MNVQNRRTLITKLAPDPTSVQQHTAIRNSRRTAIRAISYDLLFKFGSSTSTPWLQTAFWVWLGFIVTTQLPTVIFEGRKPGIYLLSIGYQFVACMAAGALLAVWKPRGTAAATT